MAKRQSISKGLRFEVFKRDSFRCQYCGRSAPDVILEIDHILPVSQGGKNELLNLVTSCRDCNRGKSNKLLSDTSAIDRQKRQLDDLNAIREQTEMLIRWKQELLSAVEDQINTVEDLVKSITGCGFTDYGRRDIRKLISRFSFSEVYEASEIAFTKYPDFEYAFSKIGGICYNRAKAGESNAK
jgi:hypothetical protein